MPPEVIVTRGLPSSVVSQLERAATVEVYTGEGAIPPEELPRTYRLGCGVDLHGVGFDRPRRD